MRRRFQQIDVFGARPGTGNPVAVVLDAEGLSTGQMQSFARWTNLSETTFVLPPTSPEADYQVRIFTLARELPFAGHPTLGTCHAWLTAGGQPRTDGAIVQECGAGLVPLRGRGDHLAFEAPPVLRDGPLAPDHLADVAAVLGVPADAVVEARWADNGPGWVAVLLEDAEAVLALEPDAGRSTAGGELDIGVVGPYPEGAEHAYEVRAFFSDHRGQLLEDPVTGSLNASVAQWLLATGRVTAPYLASQGARTGGAGRIRVAQDDDGSVWIGGATDTVITGEVDL